MDAVPTFKPLSICELSGDTGSTLVIADALAGIWRQQGHQVESLAPVRSKYDVSQLWHIVTHRPHYDVIHAHLGRAAQMAQMVSRLWHIPSFATLHGYQSNARRYRGFSHLTAVSEGVKAHYVAQGLPAEKITVIYNGYEDMLYDVPEISLRQRYTWLDQSHFIFGNAGTLSEQKHQSALLRAFAAVHAAYPHSRLLIAGVGPKKAELEVLIAELSLQQVVALIGFESDLRPFYASLDAYVQSSLHEGFCMPLLEAMACGVPVISTRSGGPEEFIFHDETGRFTNGFDAEHLAVQMRWMIEHPDARYQMAKRAQTQAKRFRWPLLASQYMQIIKEVIA